MIESPLLREIVEEAKREGRVDAMLIALETRFESVTPTITAGLQQVKDYEKLVRLTCQAVICASLQAFEEALRQELPTPSPSGH